MSARELITDHLDLWTGAVTHKSGGGRGSNGKIELTGIKKLRELILELAVRGKLVEQDPSDEPASVLLERIAEEKARLVKKGKVKKPNKLPSIEDDEKPFELSPGWNWCRLAEVADVIRGVTYKKHDVVNESSDHHVALLRANNIQASINKFDVIYIPRERAKESQMILENDILIAMSSGSANLVGKAAQASEDLEATFGAFCAAIRPHCSDIAKYMGLYTSTPAYRSQAQAAGKGIGINNLNKKALDMMLVPIPPLDEQPRIVEKVDELMALCDRLEQQVGDQLEAHEVLVDTLLDALTCSADAVEVAENWARLAEHFDILFTTEASIDKLRKTILQLAVMGRLVPQDPNDEPASVLLEKIAEEKTRLVKEGKIKRLSKPKEISSEEHSFPLRKGWEFIRFISALDFQGGSQPPKSSFSPTKGKGYVQLIQIRDLGPKPEPVFVPEGKVSKFCTPNDILIGRYGASVGKVFWGKSGAYNVALIKIDNKLNAYNQNFLFNLMNSPSGQSLFLGISRSAQDGFSKNDIADRVLPLPPIQEQHRIVEKVDELMALCDQLKARLGEAGETRTHLAEAVVERR